LVTIIIIIISDIICARLEIALPVSAAARLSSLLLPQFVVAAY